MKKLLLILTFILLSSSVIAVQSINFNYEFNNTKSIVYSNIVKDDSIVLNLQTDINSLYCKYDESAGKSYDSMDGTFDFSFQTLHKKSFSYLDEGVYKFYVKCMNENNSIGQESELIFSIINPVKAEIYLSKNSPVSSGLVEITLKTTKQLSQKPTLSYSTDGSKYESIPLSGSNDLWQGYIIIPNTLKESIGSFKFRGIDLDGIVGEEITEGEIFLIDTVRPSQINEIDAEGRDKDVYLEWRFNEDYSYFNIYRSKFPNVEYTDFYKKVDKKSFTDNDVDVGRLYYYKITAVDKAGNEGDLSYEISSIAINELINDSENEYLGLDPELIGIVDSFLYDLGDFYSRINEIKSNLNSNFENDDLLEILSLISEIDSSAKEMESLEKEVLVYKEQKLTRVELEKKITNAKSKLNVIKKKTPESFSIISEIESNRKYEESIMNEVLLSLGKSQDEINDLIKKSKKIMDEQEFSYSVSLKNIEIYFADGSKLTKGVIVKEINLALGNNGSIIEYIPKEIAQKASDINFKENNYEVLKEDPIISFGENVRKLVYIIDGGVETDLIGSTQTFFLVNDMEVSSKNKITGFLIFEKGLNSNYSIVFLFIFVLGVFTFYFFKSKNSKKDLEILDIIGDKLIEAKFYLETKNHTKLNEIYFELNEYYKELSDKSKSEVYNKLLNFNKQIKFLKISK